MPKHTAGDSDSIPSLAHENGHFWETLWNHPANAELKSKRKTPYVLAPGDLVEVPELRLKDYDGAADTRHKFVRKGVPAKIKIQLFRLGEPRRNEPYVLIIDDEVIHGTTDGDGIIERYVTPNSKGGVLKLDGGKEVYPVRIGELNPVDTTSGARQRLNNLGYNAGEGSEPDDQFRESLSVFQKDHGLQPTGELDDDTRSKLESIHQ
jgi:N-acetylmuramoyl-L-alanine amidase